MKGVAKFKKFFSALGPGVITGAAADAHSAATAIEPVVEESLEPRAYVTTHLESAANHDQLHPDGHRDRRPDR
jgi:hypothetical protein